MRERSMRLLKEFFGYLLLAAIIVAIGQFLPVLNVLFDDFFTGLIWAAMIILVTRMLYKSRKAMASKLSPEMRKRREKESQDRWDETCEATFSLSQPLDLRNMTKIRSIFDRH